MKPLAIPDPALSFCSLNVAWSAISDFPRPVIGLFCDPEAGGIGVLQMTSAHRRPDSRRRRELQRSF